MNLLRDTVIEGFGSTLKNNSHTDETQQTDRMSINYSTTINEETPKELFDRMPSPSAVPSRVELFAGDTGEKQSPHTSSSDDLRENSVKDTDSTSHQGKQQTVRDELRVGEYEDRSKKTDEATVLEDPLPAVDQQRDEQQPVGLEWTKTVLMQLVEKQNTNSWNKYVVDYQKLVVQNIQLKQQVEELRRTAKLNSGADMSDWDCLINDKGGFPNTTRRHSPARQEGGGGGAGSPLLNCYTSPVNNKEKQGTAGHDLQSEAVVAEGGGGLKKDYLSNNCMMCNMCNMRYRGGVGSPRSKMKLCRSSWKFIAESESNDDDDMMHHLSANAYQHSRYNSTGDLIGSCELTVHRSSLENQLSSTSLEDCSYLPLRGSPEVMVSDSGQENLDQCGPKSVSQNQWHEITQSASDDQLNHSLPVVLRLKERQRDSVSVTRQARVRLSNCEGSTVAATAQLSAQIFAVSIENDFRLYLGHVGGNGSLHQSHIKLDAKQITQITAIPNTHTCLSAGEDVSNPSATKYVVSDLYSMQNATSFLSYGSPPCQLCGVSPSLFVSVHDPSVMFLWDLRVKYPLVWREDLRVTASGGLSAAIASAFHAPSRSMLVCHNDGTISNWAVDERKESLRYIGKSRLRIQNPKNIFVCPHDPSLIIVSSIDGRGADATSSPKFTTFRVERGCTVIHKSGRSDRDFSTFTFPKDISPRVCPGINPVLSDICATGGSRMLRIWNLRHCKLIGETPLRDLRPLPSSSVHSEQSTTTVMFTAHKQNVSVSSTTSSVTGNVSNAFRRVVRPVTFSLPIERVGSAMEYGNTVTPMGKLPQGIPPRYAHQQRVFLPPPVASSVQRNPTLTNYSTVSTDPSDYEQREKRWRVSAIGWVACDNEYQMSNGGSNSPLHSSQRERTKEFQADVLEESGYNSPSLSRRGNHWGHIVTIHNNSVMQTWEVRAD